MKGIILAGGLGTRLLPLTLVTNKHLLPVYDRPMIYFPIQTLLNINVRDVLIVTGRQHADDFTRLLKDGTHLGLERLTFAYQDGERGIADALLQAEDFARGHNTCVVLGDNLIQGNLRQAAQDFTAQPSGSRSESGGGGVSGGESGGGVSGGAKLILKEVPDPHRFGVAQLDGPRITAIHEKPQHPPSNLAVTGFYFYPPDVFDVCRQLQPSARGELEITDVNNAYVRAGRATYHLLEGWWSDAGTIESLLNAARLVARGGANLLPPDFPAPPAPPNPQP